MSDINIERKDIHKSRFTNLLRTESRRFVKSQNITKLL